MTRIALALTAGLVVLAPATAHAKGCHEPRPVVGYTHCYRFGHGWATTFSASMEAGPIMLRFDPGRIDTTAYSTDRVTTYHLTSLAGDRSPVIAYGATIDRYIMIRPWIYVAMQSAFAGVASGPQIQADVSARGTTMMMPSTTSGFIGQMLWLVGTQHAAGPLVLGVEAGPGVRMGTYFTSQLPDSVSSGAMVDFVFDVHARANLFLSPKFSLGVQLGTDVVHAGNYSLAFVIGGHFLPYDAAR